MGRATRWFKSLLRGKKESRDNTGNGCGSIERQEKKRWSFGKSGREPGNGAAPIIRATTQEEAAWLRSVYSDTDEEQNKHAIAVAAATAAAADAAVAAAQAAVAVVRLTSQGRGFGTTMFVIAAVKIQTVFRAYLAKKALRALKALVKLQALVRGYLVRKQASATLHSMQALIRAQATVRAQKSRANDRRYQTETRPRRSLERFDETGSEHLASIHSRRLSASLDNNGSSYGFDRSPKIVEVDTCRPKSRSYRRTTTPSSAMDPPGDDLPPVPMSSPLPCGPARINIPDCPIFQDYDWCIPVDRCHRFFSTAHSTPRCYAGPASNAPPTPAKSVCAADVGVFRRFMPNCPNYMLSTQSFEAKVRSQSAPKQRPETVVSLPRKRIPLSEMMVESRASLSGVGMERSCSKVQEEAFSFKSAVMSRFDKSLELGRGDAADRDFYLQRKW